ncbi:MAG: glycosyltransferase [Acidobacteria bacterium]|nr:glycosyltransferase [Acidobacteriota bacterium]
MKVVNVVMTLDPVRGGGTAERTIHMSRSLASRGVDCTVLTTDGGLSEEVRRRLGGAELVALPSLSRRYHVPRRSRGVIRDLIGAADVVHLINHWTVLNAIAYKAAREVGKPYVICPAGALHIFGRSRIKKRLYNLLVGRAIVAHASAHIAIAPNERPHFRAYGVPSDRVLLIPNGVDPADFPSSSSAGFRESYGLQDHPYILFVGRLSPIKGPDLLLRAFCELGRETGDYHLVIAGPDAGMKPDLLKMASQHGLRDRVHFPGYLSGIVKAGAYHCADLVVIPSRQEAMSIVVLEAAICGRPVLLTDSCGFDEVSTTGGGLVAAATAGALRTGLQRLLADRTGLAAMGSRLQRFVESSFTWNRIIDDYLALFARLTGRSVG